ncbi:mucin TcMUCII [Trypanosoma cruzi]|nr:mucin TcMUCII [Trypanosoma cruzi]
MQTSVNIQTETQMNGCLLYAIPCAYFWLCCCCCCGAQAFMKRCALNMNEDQRQLNCFCDEYWLHFPWANNPRGVRGSFPYLLLCFCFAVCAALPLVCVRTLREGCRHDGPLSPCVHAVEPCVPLLFASPSSICVLVLRQGCVCVCLLPWIGVCVVRGVRRTVHAWLLPSPHVVCPLCVFLPHLSSPLLLSMSLTVQVSSTPLNDHTHDDDVPSAVRPVGARPVLLPVRVRDNE